MHRHFIISLGVLLGIATAMTLRWMHKSETAKPAKFALPGLPGRQAPPMSPTEVKVIKDNSWAKAVERMDAADQASIAQIDKSLELIGQFFDDRKKNSRTFASQLLELSGKWELIKSFLPGQDENSYHRYLQEKFEACFFKDSDITDVLAAVVATHQSELDGIENQLLIDLRADIDNVHPGAVFVIPGAQSELAFATSFRSAKAQATPLLIRDLKIAAATEVLSFVASEMATRLALRVVSGVATRMGISAGILSIGVGAGVATFGVSILAGILVDEIIARLMKAAGNDPETEISQRVNHALDGARDALISGHPEAVGVYRLALKMVHDDPNSEIRVEAAKTVTALEKGGALGLKRELLELTKFRSAQRRAALESQILGKSFVQGVQQ